MRTRKPKIHIAMVYVEEARSGFQVMEAHYLGQSAMPDGTLVTGAGRTWNDAVTEVRKAAAIKLTPADPEGWGIHWEWAPDGRKGFPQDVELKIRVEEDKLAKLDAERKARAYRLRGVAEEIKKTAAPPAGYTWEIHEPEQDCDIGDRLWLYAKKGEDGIALYITRKADKFGPGYEIWIEGPGYGREARRCKAGSKGPWVDKAVSFIIDHIQDEATKVSAEIARKQYAANKKALRDEIVAATPGTVADYDFGIAFGERYSGNHASIGSASETGVSIELKLSLDPDDAKAIIKLAAEACARRKARNDAELAAHNAAAAAPAPAQS